jgi:hypothetical protein
MAEDKTFTKAELDAAIAEAKEAQDTKNAELLNEVKKLKAEVRKVKEINPEDVAAIEAERDKLAADLALAQKAAKEATTAAEKATKALEAESTAARNDRREAVLASEVAALGIVPQLAEGFKALHRDKFKTELVDGKYVVTGPDGQSPKDYLAAVAASEEGKVWVAAPINGGGGAPGGKGGEGAKSRPESEVLALPAKQRAEFFASGGEIAP